MRKFKGLFVSLSMAAMFAMGAMTAGAEETETTETVEAQSETEAASESAAAKISADEGVSESDQQSLAAYAEQSISTIVAMTDEEMAEILHPTSILSIPQDSVVVSVESWEMAREELGAFQSFTEHKISVNDDVITVESTCAFENSQGVVTTTLERDTLTMEGMNFSGAAQSFGQKMSEAGLNTLMGLGVVFAVLVFLSFLIGQFKRISEMEAKMQKKDAAPAPQPQAAPAVAAPAVEEAVADDGELIAVIAAAIAAAEGTSTDGFVVRSIKKSNRNKWQRA